MPEPDPKPRIVPHATVEPKAPKIADGAPKPEFKPHPRVAPAVSPLDLSRTAPIVVPHPVVPRPAPGKELPAPPRLAPEPKVEGKPPGGGAKPPIIVAHALPPGGDRGDKGGGNGGNGGGAPNPKPLTDPDHIWPRRATMGRVLVAGFLGGMVAPMVRTLQTFFSDTSGAAQLDITIAFPAILSAAVGGTFVWMLREEDTMKALILGLTWPFLITTLASTNSGTDKSKPDNPSAAAATPAPGTQKVNDSIKTGGAVGWIPFFSSSAYAQEPAPPPAPAPAPARPMRAELVTVDTAFPYNVEFLDKEGNVINTQAIEAALPPALTVLPLNPRVSAVRITSGSATSAPVKFTYNDQKTVGIAIRATAFGTVVGGLQALGKKAEKVVTALDLDAEVRPLAKVGTEAYIFLGKRKDNAWAFKVFEANSSELPEEGDTLTISFPVNMRRDNRGTDTARVAILSVGQQVKVTEQPTGSLGIWAKVKVVN